jgi:predicted Zn-dependent protease
MYKVLVCLLMTLVVGACQPGTSLGPGDATTLASAAQEDCGFVQNVYGQRVSWKKDLPIRLYISKDFPREFEAVIHTAAKQWEDAAGMTLFNIAYESSLSAAQKDNRNVIYWNKDWTAKANLQAITNLYWTTSKIAEADLSIDAKYFTYFIDRPVASDDIHLQSLVLHEMGHVLGLKHRSTMPSVMWPILSASTKRDQLTDSDRKSLKCEY